MDSRLIVNSSAGDIIPFGAYQNGYSPRAKDVLEEQLVVRLLDEGISDFALVGKIASLFRSMRQQKPSDELPKPIVLIPGYKALVFQRSDTVEFYLYPKKNKENFQNEQKGKGKVMVGDAIAIAISNFDEKLIQKENTSKIKRFNIDLTDHPTYLKREEAFKHEVKLLERVSKNTRFTKLLAWTIFEGSKDKKPLRKGIMFQEYCPNGDLEDKIKTFSSNEDKRTRLNKYAPLFRTLLEALIVLEKEKIIHSDLTPANILFDEKFNAVIADLEFALFADEFHDQQAISKYVCRGTPEFMAPEKVLVGLKGQLLQDADLSANVWSIGCILHKLYYGLWPLASKEVGAFTVISNEFMANKSKKSSNEILTHRANQEVTVNKIRQIYKDMENSANRTQDNGSVDYLITMMLHPDPKKRITPRRALAYFDAAK